MSVCLASVRECMRWSILAQTVHIRTKIIPGQELLEHRDGEAFRTRKRDERNPVLRGRPIPLPANQMYHDTLFYGQTLRLVDRQREASHRGNCVRVILVPSLTLVMGNSGTHVGSLE